MKFHCLSYLRPDHDLARQTPPMNALGPMRRRIGAAGVIVSAIAYCAVAPEPPARAASDRQDAVKVTCHIEVKIEGGLLRLQAVARSEEPLSGRYSFSVSKHNQSGTSENAQSGDFSLLPTQTGILATTALEAAATGFYSARLDLRWEQGSTTCRAP